MTLGQDNLILNIGHDDSESYEFYRVYGGIYEADVVLHFVWVIGSFMIHGVYEPHSMELTLHIRQRWIE